MWGASSGSQPLSQGREKVIVDGSDLEEWPSIAAGDLARTGDKAVTGGAEGNVLPNCSASWGDRHLQQPQVLAGANEGRKGVSSDSPSPPTPSSSTNECMQPSSVVWGTQGTTGGNAVATGSLPSISKASIVPGTDSPIGVNCGFPGANFNPNANPSAWPALVPDRDGGGATEGGTTSLQSSTSLSANNSISVNQASHQQRHQMQYRDMESSSREWGGTALEPGAGPKNTAPTEVGDGDSGSTGEEDLSLSSTSLSNWRAQPFPANSKTGASRTDTWEGGSGGSSGTVELANSWGLSGQDDRRGPVGGNSWGTGSQGAWNGGLGDWGSSSGVSNPGGGNGDGSSSNSSTSGGSVGNPSVASTTPSTMTKAWDNQKGTGDGGTGDSTEWGGQGNRGGGGASSSSGGGNSRSGNQHHGHHHSHPTPNPEVALQNLINRPDLDPRVLSNSGWGQTQIRQNVAWDLEADAAGTTRSTANNAPSSVPPYSSSAGASTTAQLSVSQNTNLNSNSVLGPPTSEKWDNGSSSSLTSRGTQPPVATTQNPGGNGAGHLSGQIQSSGGWGESSPSESQGKGWASEGQEWRDHSAGGGSGGWGDVQQQGTQVGGGGDWGSSQEEKGTGGWNERGRGDVGNWGQRSGSEWGERETKANTGGWSEGKDSGGTRGTQEVDSWSRWDDAAPRKAWGTGGTETVGVAGGNDKTHSGWGGNVHPSQMPNSQSTSLKGQAQQQQQSQSQQSQSLDTGAIQGGWVRQAGPSAPSQSSGWTSGPIPQITSDTATSSEPSGWEEPSPQSISRKKEIDDGTSAWGDPNNYNFVNYWDKNNSPSGQSQPPQQQGPPSLAGRAPASLGNRDINPTVSSNKGPTIGKPVSF